MFTVYCIICGIICFYLVKAMISEDNEKKITKEED
jgi:hypothetical protein